MRVRHSLNEPLAGYPSTADHRRTSAVYGQAEVHSISAVGEQYVDLVPNTDAAPYLGDGSVIAMARTTVPQQIGPVLDQASALLGSIPRDTLNAVLDESFKGLHGAGYDFGSLMDSSAALSSDFNRVGDRARALIDDSAPLLDSEVDTTDAIRTWAHSLAGVTDQLVHNDPQIRSLLQNGPAAINEVSQLLTQIKPTLPVLLANLTTLGQSPSPTTRHPNRSWCCSHPSSRLSKQRSHETTRRESPPAANSPSPLAIPTRARSASSRPRSGGHQPTPPPSTPQMGSTANSHRTPRAPFAVPATIRAWAIRGNAPPRCNSATATSPLNH